MRKLLFAVNNSKNFIVRVQNGFINTCLKYEVSPSRVIAINNLSDIPSENFILLIEKDNTVLHIVTPTDNEENIEGRYGISVSEILRYNSASFLYPYQILEIPREKA